MIRHAANHHLRSEAVRAYPGSMTTLEFQVPSAEWKREFKGFCAEHGRTMREVAA